MAKSALRVLEIMEFVATSKSGSATHSQISQALGIPKSSLTSLLLDLQQPGYLDVDKETGRYSVGSQVMFLAHAYIRHLNIVRLGAPVVHDVFLKLNIFTSMVVPKDDDCIVVCSEALPSPLAHSLNIGQRIPMLHTALGRAILAFLDPTEIDRYLSRYQPVQYASRTKTRIKDLRTALDEIRASGYAYVQDEYLPGIIGIAAPVFNMNNRPIAAIGTAISTSQESASLEAAICEQLLPACQALSRRLGASLTATNPALFQDRRQKG